jgi:putative transposase
LIRWYNDKRHEYAALSPALHTRARQGNQPIELFSYKVLHPKLDYIHYNPVEAGIVEKPKDYLYGSARNYYDLAGLINITLVDPLVQ